MAARLSVPLDSIGVPVRAPRSAGIGLRIPPREADCSGVRPSWYPFQINVCDGELDPEDRDLTGREMSTDPAFWA